MNKYDSYGTRRDSLAESLLSLIHLIKVFRLSKAVNHANAMLEKIEQIEQILIESDFDEGLSVEELERSFNLIHSAKILAESQQAPLENPDGQQKVVSLFHYDRELAAQASRRILSRSYYASLAIQSSASVDDGEDDGAEGEYQYELPFEKANKLSQPSLRIVPLKS